MEAGPRKSLVKRLDLSKAVSATGTDLRKSLKGEETEDGLGLDQRRSSIVCSAFPTALQRKSLQAENVHNLFMELNLNPEPFGRRKSKGDDKGWKPRNPSLQNYEAKLLRENFQQQKQRLQAFTKNNTLGDFFKGVENIIDNARKPLCKLNSTLSHVTYGTGSIQRKHLQNREMQGVWSPIGKPYACHGVPATYIPRSCIFPKGLKSLDFTEENNIKFFDIQSRSHVELGFKDKSLDLDEDIVSSSTIKDYKLEKMKQISLYVQDLQQRKLQRKGMEARNE